MIFFGLCIQSISLHAQNRNNEDPDRVVYSSFRPENWDIYHFAETGDTGSALTHHVALDYEPVISPDGRWVVFTSERRKSPDLFVIDLLEETPSPRLLIESEAMEDQASFSPGGDTLYFMSSASGNADIYSIPFKPNKSQGMDQATNLSRHPGGDFRPSVSPDGRLIAFSTDRDVPPVGHERFRFSRKREGEIYTMRTDGSEQKRITHLPDWDGSPIWSKDGQSLYFYSTGGREEVPVNGPLFQEGGFRIWAVNLDGGTLRPISPEDLVALWPTRIPGNRIAFAARSPKPAGTPITLTAGFNDEWYIYSVDENGGDLRLESDTTRRYWAPDVHSSAGMVAHGQSHKEPDQLPGCGHVGRLLAAEYPMTRKIGEHEVRVYGMRHGTAVIPHPVHSRVALECSDSSGSRIITTDMDGSDPRELVRIDPTETAPGPTFGMKWSKDGKWLTYTVGPFWGRSDQEVDIWRIRQDGTGRKNLSIHLSGNNGMPDFSRDGEYVVFRSSHSGSFDLYLLELDSSAKPLVLTDDEAKDNFPVFSPSEDLIAFVSNREGAADATGFRDFDIFTLTLTEEGLTDEIRRITDAPGHDSHVQFSPDGDWLIYSSEQGGINDEEPVVQEVNFTPQMYGEIYAYRLRDGKILRLTDNKWEDGAPSWVRPAQSDYE